MTVAELKLAMCQRIDEDGANPVWWTDAELLAAVNEAQQVFTFLTLCLEATSSFTFKAGRTFYRIRGYIGDFLLPLRVMRGTYRMSPARLDDLAARDDSWQATAGAPERYAQLGCSVLAVTPQPATDTAGTITHARTPAVLTLNIQSPEVPSEWHEDLADYGTCYLLLKDGGTFIKPCVERFNRFVDGAAKAGNFVRQRSMAARYDRLPAELDRIDRSRMFGSLLGGKTK